MRARIYVRAWSQDLITSPKKTIPNYQAFDASTEALSTFSPSFFPSKPQFSSTALFSGIPFIKTLTTSPAQLTPTRSSQIGRRLLANARRTSVLRGSGNVRMRGMIEYATEVLVGMFSSTRRLDGSRSLSSFWRMAPPAVTPQICRFVVKVSENEPNVKIAKGLAPATYTSQTYKTPMHSR